ncbi:MAG: WD40 repeat domain-containing protein [Saprospiraceae bacterium]
MWKRLHQLTGHRGSIYSLAAAPDGSVFYSVGGDGWVTRWQTTDPETGRLVAQTEGQLYSCALLPGGTSLAAGDMRGGLYFIPLDGTSPAGELTGKAHHTGGIYDLHPLSDDELLSAGGDGVLSSWNVATQRVTQSLRLSDQALRAVAYSPHRDLLAVGASDNGIYLVGRKSFNFIRRLEGHDNSVFTLAFHPDGRRLVSGGRDARLLTWDVNDPAENPRPLTDQAAHLGTINHLAFSPDGKLLATASRDKTLKIWSAADLRLLKVLERVRDGGHANSVNRLAWLNNGLLLSTGDDRTVVMWKKSGPG